MDEHTLKKRLQDAGYKHPDTYSLDGKTSKYKTFSDTDINRKTKDINDFGSAIAGRIYSLNKNIEDLDACPKCKSVVVKTCQCGYSDKTCKNGHIWYVDRDGSIKNGNPHT